MRTLLSVAALALLAACASKPTTSKPLTLDQKLEKSGYELGGEIDKIQSWNVDGWNRIADQHVAFSAGPSSDYLVTLMAPCRGPVRAQTIGFSVPAGPLPRLAKLVVHEQGIQDQCTQNGTE